MGEWARMALEGVDWEGVFWPSTPVLEIIVRGTITYLALFLLLRLFLKRESGQLGVTDLLVVVLIADAAQNSMAGGYRSVPDGILLVGVIVFWAFALDWVGFHFPRLQRFIRPPALQIVRDGELLYRNMRKELITTDELTEAARKAGITDLKAIREAYVEGDGRISIIADGARGQIDEQRAI